MIINNRDFYQISGDPRSKSLPVREGTEIDCSECFIWRNKEREPYGACAKSVAVVASTTCFMRELIRCRLWKGSHVTACWTSASSEFSSETYKQSFAVLVRNAFFVVLLFSIVFFDKLAFF